MRQAYKVWIAVAAAVFCVVALVDLSSGTTSRPVAASSAAPTTTVTTPSTTYPTTTVAKPSTTTPVSTTTPTTTSTTTLRSPSYDDGDIDGPSPGDQGLPDGALTGGYCAHKWWC